MPGSRAPQARLTLASRFRAFARGLGQPRRHWSVLRAVIEATTTTRVPERMAANVVDLAFAWFVARRGACWR